MRVHYRENMFEMELLDSESFISSSSGKSLMKLTGLLKVEKRFNPEGFNDLSEIRITDDEGNATDYRISVRRISDSDSWDYLEIEINCEEIEIINVKEITIGATTIQPYFYEEVSEGSALIITLKAQVDRIVLDTFKEILRLQRIPESIPYFPVKRPGMMDKEMRFGQPIWSIADSNYKVKLILVEKIYDHENRQPLGFTEPDFSNIKMMVAELNVKLGKLFRILEEKSLISESEKGEIYQYEDTELFSHFFEMKKVLDIDKYDE